MIIIIIINVYVHGVAKHCNCGFRLMITAGVTFKPNLSLGRVCTKNINIFLIF